MATQPCAHGLNDSPGNAAFPRARPPLPVPHRPASRAVAREFPVDHVIRLANHRSFVA